MLGTAASQLDPSGSPDPERGDSERYALAARLLDSLVHDARNPLNALSINIEVLAEKVRQQSGGTLPPGQEKNFKAMREQIHRIDGILRLFAPHIAQVSGLDSSVDLAQLVMQAAEVLATESRRARVRLLVENEPSVVVRGVDASKLRFVVTRALLLGIEGAPVGSELLVRVGCERGRAVLRVGSGAPRDAGALEAVAGFARQLDAEWRVSSRELTLTLPLS